MPQASGAEGGLPASVALDQLEVLAGVGSTPIVYLASQVAYLLLQGQASVHALTYQAGCQYVPLSSERVLTLSAGVLHQVVCTTASAHLLRLASHDPGFADVVYPFPFLVLADAQAYWRCAQASAEQGEGAEAAGRRLAYRHQLALQGFAELWAAFERGPRVGQAQLARLYRSAARLLAEQLPTLRTAWRSTTLRAVAQTALHLRHLEQGQADWLHAASLCLVTLSGGNPLPGLGAVARRQPAVSPLRHRGGRRP